MDDRRYSLRISFKSNERPFSTTHYPARPIDDEADALRWRDGMAEGLGDQYVVTLFDATQPGSGLTQESD